MKRIWVLSVILFCLIPPLSAIENYLPNIAREIFDTRIKTATEFIRGHEQELKTASRIIGSSLKILGAILTINGHYNFLNDIGKHMLHHLGYNSVYPDEQQKIGIDIRNLWIHQEEIIFECDDKGNIQFQDDGQPIIKSSIRQKKKIARPPYVTALCISAYLLGTGSYELYREINALIKEYKKNNPAPVTIAEIIPPTTISMQEESLSASDTISMTSE